MAAAGLVTLVLSNPVRSQDATTSDALSRSVEELRTSVGTWNAVTEFLYDDGSVARSVEGTYEFQWVVPDRVVSGTSSIPELEQVSAVLLYINEQEEIIEMVSVGSDGVLWTMTGALGGNVRTSQEYDTGNGPGQLRFTRYNVSADAFESRMEYTDDGGATWKAGNHQVFRRAPDPTTGGNP